MRKTLALFAAVLALGLTATAFDAEARRLGRHPTLPGEIGVEEGFRRVGADAWDALRSRYR